MQVGEIATSHSSPKYSTQKRERKENNTDEITCLGSDQMPNILNTFILPSAQLITSQYNERKDLENTKKMNKKIPVKGMSLNMVCLKHEAVFP